MNNIFENIILDKENEEFIDILKKPNIRIERIVSNGQKSDKDFWYIQEENEFVIVLEGEAILELVDKEIILNKGDFYNIDKGLKHRVKYTSLKKTTIWIAVFY
ncbi:MAG: cupin domain-containing protein [Campylobacteraceae bacterium]|nr:cupin domain-containing protein [Campylobacteraceae bacterium]